MQIVTARFQVGWIAITAGAHLALIESREDLKDFRLSPYPGRLGRSRS